MDSREPKYEGKRKFAKSFRVAFSGLFQAIRREGHMRFHLLAAAVVIIAGFIFQVSYMEWLILLLVIAGVIALELVNTAIEAAVNLTTAYDHPVAKLAKDVSAAAVLIFAIVAVVIAVVIFTHHLVG